MADKKKFIEKLHTHLFTDEKEVALIFTKPEQDMILRYRAIFTKWLSDWHLADKEMVSFIKKEFNMSSTMAYVDIANVKLLLGNVATAGKEFQRFRATEMVMEAYNLANEAENKFDVMRAEVIVKAAAALVKIHKLNLNEPQQLPFDEIVPGSFETTGDVSVLGIKPIPNLKEVQEKLRQKYSQFTRQQIVDVQYEDVPTDG